MDIKQAQQLLDNFSSNDVPMINYCHASIVGISPKHCEVKIPLADATKNHLNCMYFGALSVGADVAGGLLAMMMIKQTKQPIDLLFKDFNADFKLRANGDTHFTCNDGMLIQDMITQAITTKKRINQEITVTATSPSISNTPVAIFKLTLSIKLTTTTQKNEH